MSFTWHYVSFIFFFFSSRRRHTRFKCDWSSDVCSSDLLHGLLVIGGRSYQLGRTCFSIPRDGLRTLYTRRDFPDRGSEHLPPPRRLLLVIVASYYGITQH